MTVLPNVNTTLFYDVQAIMSHVDYVTLAAYDFQTWERNNLEGKITPLYSIFNFIFKIVFISFIVADYPAPIYPLHDRIPESNIDAQVQLWLSNGAPANKIIIAIPTHARSWQLTQDSTKTGVPPILEVNIFDLFVLSLRQLSNILTHKYVTN